MKKNRAIFQRLFLISLLLGCLCSFETLNAETTFPETKALHGRTIPIDTA